METFKFWIDIGFCPEGSLQSKTLDFSPKGGGGGEGGVALFRLLMPQFDSQNSQQCCLNNFTTFSRLTFVPSPA